MFIRPLLFLAAISVSPVLNSQIVINEVQLKPQTDAAAHQWQSLAHTTANWGAEFIEIYNTSCVSVDIGCWVISSESFGTSTRDGSYRIPAGTMLGPHGYLSIGGPISGAGINMSPLLVAVNPHLKTADATRWYLDNGDAYVALFNASGAPADAVFWTVSAAESAKWATDSDLNQAVSQIPNPPGCSVIASFPLPSAASMVAVVEYAGQSPAIGNSLARIQDGGPWTRTGVPSPGATNGVFDPCPILPVELIGFDAICASDEISLLWQTASEINNDYFEVQYSQDGYNYEPISTIDGAGNSFGLIEYEYHVVDRSLFKGYFRLKQVDYNGAFEYSPVKYVDCRSNSPFVQIINCQLVVSCTDPILECMVYDLTGRLIHDSPHYEEFKTSSANAFYYVHLTTTSGLTIHKVHNH